MKTCFLSSGYAFVQSFFFWCWKSLLKLGGIIFKRKIFSCLWYPFFFFYYFIFLPEEAVFLYCGNVFSNKHLILGSTNQFLYIFSENPAGESLFLSSGNVFLNKSFIPAIGEGFFPLMETVTLLESFLLLAETVTAMSGNQF